MTTGFATDSMDMCCNTFEIELHTYPDEGKSLPTTKRSQSHVLLAQRAEPKTVDLYVHLSCLTGNYIE